MITTTRRSAGRPTKDEAAAIDNRILDCARTAFCRQGISACAVDEIAADAGVTKHTIYRRYPTKIALIDAVVDRKLAELKMLVEAESDAAHDPVETLRLRALRLFTHQTEPDNLAFILFLEAEAAFSPELRERFAAWEGIVTGPLCEVLAEAKAQGRMPGREVEATCAMLGDLLHGASQRLFASGHAADGPAVTAMFDLRWSLFCDAVFRRPPQQG